MNENDDDDNYGEREKEVQSKYLEVKSDEPDNADDNNNKNDKFSGSSSFVKMKGNLA